MLERELGDLGDVVRARRGSFLPTVLSQAEVEQVLDYLHVMERPLTGVRSPLDAFGSTGRK